MADMEREDNSQQYAIDEALATLETEVIDAMTELVAEHGYTESDLENLVSAAMRNA